MEKIVLSIALCMAMAALTFTAREGSFASTEKATKLEPPLYTLDPVFVEVLTLGHKELYGHFLSEWVGHVLYDWSLPMEAADEVTSILGRIARWGVEVEAPYILGCSALYDVFKRPEACEDILKQGMIHAKSSWFIPALLGLVKGNLEASPAEVASYFYIASTKPGSPASFGKAASRMMSEETLTKEQVSDIVESLEGLDEIQLLRQHLYQRLPEPQ